jgi:uncharacterized membrane protein YkvA (DUF1232 family)
MFTLNEETKDKFQKQVSKINAKDESKVKKNIDKEIAVLEKKIQKKPSHKIQSLINNTKLLYEILENDSFPISESTRKWIIFGLGYLVSDIDLIPDSIPNIGYLDDAMILSWVLSMIDEDVTRYEFFKKAKAISKSAKITKELVQGNGEQLIILLPGFIENILDDKDETAWLKTMRTIDNGFSSPGYSILHWSLSYLEEFSKLVPIIDHNLTLKPVFDFENTQINWQQLKIDLTNIGKAFAKDLMNIHLANPDKEIDIISLNVSSFILASALNELDNNIIDKIYLMGAANTEEEIQKSISNKVTHVFNFHSKNDHALKFIYDNLEENNMAVGLKFLQANQKVLVTNIDASKEILRHHDYKFKLSELINKI